MKNNNNSYRIVSCRIMFCFIFCCSHGKKKKKKKEDIVLLGGESRACSECHDDHDYVHARDHDHGDVHDYEKLAAAAAAAVPADVAVRRPAEDFHVLVPNEASHGPSR